MENDPLMDSEARGKEYLPAFASTANKHLNEEIRRIEKVTSQILAEIEVNNERVRVMAEHLKNVQQELLNTQKLCDSKNKEIETEDHLKQLAEREAGRLKAEITKMQKEATDLQDQLNIVQNNIFKGNEKMDQFKLLMNWNQEELEQWALAARQKEDDNLALQKYMRSDEVKLKELTLQIEKLQKEVQRKKSELDSEVTETQAAQIELDKTAEDFRNLHKERQDLIKQWEEAIEAMQRRDDAIRSAGERFADGKLELAKKQEKLGQNADFLKKMEDNNKEEDAKIAVQERMLTKLRTEFISLQSALNAFQDEVEVVKNTLAKVATDLSQKRGENVNLKADLEEKNRKLERSNRNLQFTQKKLESELLKMDNLELRSQQIDDLHKQEEEKLKGVEKDLALLKDTMFKNSQELFKLRQDEANLIAEISGAQTANKNMQSKIQKLDSETLKQQELIYNAEFQIQQLERKVARASGERTDEEKKILNAKITELQKQLDNQNAEYNMLVQQSKRLSDDLRTTRRRVAENAKERQAFADKIADLTLQNDTLARKLRTTIKSKEEVLVQHDVLKLDVKRLRDLLNLRADEVYGLENRKFQLQMSMEQREREIKVLLETLRAQHRLAEDERHNSALDLNVKLTKVDKLEKKYQVMISRLPQEEGEEERTQAFYVIKAAQDREELQREGDELDGRIQKTEREVKALERTLDKLNTANGEYRGSFSRVDTSGKDMQDKAKLEEQLDKVARTVKYRRREQEALEQDVAAMESRLQNVLQEEATLQQRVSEVDFRRQQLDREIAEKLAKKDRAYKTFQRVAKELRRARNVADTEETLEEKDVRLQEIKQMNKALLSNLIQLTKDFPQIATAFEDACADAGVRPPSRPPSTADLDRPGSARSSGSRASIGSGGSVSSKKSAVSSRSSSSSRINPTRPPHTVQLGM